MALANPTATTQYGNVSGGIAYPDACPTGEAVVGYHGYLASPNGYLGQLQAVCGTLSIAAGATPSVAVGTGTTLPLRGTLSSTEWTAACPANAVVVGFAGRSGLLIDQLTVRCAPLAISQQGNTHVVAVSTTTDLAPVGGTGGSAFPQTDCPNGAVATVSNIRAGNGIDAFGVGCSAVSLVFP